MTTALVQVKLELGHKATPRTRPSNDGHTHTWKVFVRGPEGCNIQHFVDKVIFNLHPTYPKPRRVCKEPPYEVEESGYAGFNVEINIHFRNKNEPKKITFMYDLFLKTDDVVNHIRCEKLTFQNPTEDFRRRLLKSGGFGITGSGGANTETTGGETVTSKTSISTSPKQAPPLPKRPKTAEDKAFSDLFGEPILKGEVSKKKKITKPEKKPAESISSNSSKSPGGDQKSSEKSSSKPAKHSEKPRSHSHSKESSSSSKGEHTSSAKHSSASQDSHSVVKHSSEKSEKSSSASSKSATKRPHDIDEESRDSVSSKKKKVPTATLR